jgi:hypothetical protein
MSIKKALRYSLYTLLAGSACLGCESAHYVLKNPDRGVVAIPEDTPKYRAEAEKLMHDQFPSGYVIDDVRVVPLGRPYQTVTQVGPIAEIETHQRHEVQLSYHAGQAMPVMPPSPRLAAPVPVVQPAAATMPQAGPDGLPAQPVPVSR